MLDAARCRHEKFSSLRFYFLLCVLNWNVYDLMEFIFAGLQYIVLYTVYK